MRGDEVGAGSVLKRRAREAVFRPDPLVDHGVLVLASQAYTGSSRFRARVSSDRLAEVQKANSQRFVTAAVFGVGLFCT